MINVTKEHIKNSTHSCPISLALLEQHGCHFACVFDNRGLFLRAHFSDRLESYLMPASAKDFIYRFDRGLPVEPFSFELIIREI